jgi:hypothetical protein
MINNTKNFKAIVFDYGGVLEINKSGNILESIANLINVPIKEFKREYFKYNYLT